MKSPRVSTKVSLFSIFSRTTFFSMFVLKKNHFPNSKLFFLAFFQYFFFSTNLNAKENFSFSKKWMLSLFLTKKVQSSSLMPYFLRTLITNNHLILTYTSVDLLNASPKKRHGMRMVLKREEEKEEESHANLEKKLIWQWKMHRLRSKYSSVKKLLGFFKR